MTPIVPAGLARSLGRSRQVRLAAGLGALFWVSAVGIAVTTNSAPVVTAMVAVAAASLAGAIGLTVIGTVSLRKALGAFQAQATSTLADLRAAVSSTEVQLSELDQSLAHADQGIAQLDGTISALRTETPPSSTQSEISQLDGTIQAEARNLASQIESLLSIFHALQPSFPIPPSGGWAMDADLLAFVVEETLRRQPKKVVEFGSGTSTILLAMTLGRLGAGKVISFDHDPDYADRTRQMLRDRGLQDLAVVVTSPLDELEVAGDSYLYYRIPSDIDLSETELVVVDGPPGSTGALARLPAFPVIRPHLAESWMVILDDAKRPDEAKAAEAWHASCEGSDLRFLPHHKGTAILTSG